MLAPKSGEPSLNGSGSVCYMSARKREGEVTGMRKGERKEREGGQREMGRGGEVEGDGGRKGWAGPDKTVSNCPGLANLPVGQVDLICHLPDRQVWSKV